MCVSHGLGPRSKDAPNPCSRQRSNDKDVEQRRHDVEVGAGLVDAPGGPFGVPDREAQPSSAGVVVGVVDAEYVDGVGHVVGTWSGGERSRGFHTRQVVGLQDDHRIGESVADIRDERGQQAVGATDDEGVSSPVGARPATPRRMTDGKVRVHGQHDQCERVVAVGEFVEFGAGLGQQRVVVETPHGTIVGIAHLRP